MRAGGLLVRERTGTEPGPSSPRTPGRLLRPALADVALAAALTVFAQLNLRFGIDGSTPFGSTWAVDLCTAVATGALAFRRVAPLGTALTVMAAVAGPQLVTVLTISLWGDFVPMLVATYSVTRHGNRRSALVGVSAVVTGLVVILLRVPSIGAAANIPFAVVPIVVLASTGRVLRRREHSHAALTRQADRLAEEQAEWVREAVVAERGRIARELHDVVAHCVSVMVIQAGAAEDMLDRDPDAARRPLRAVQDTGQQAVEELGRMLGLLRGASESDALLPQPGVQQLPELVEQVRSTGLDVHYERQGRPRQLPPGIDLALYRLVQEALTNTLKHARATRTSVLLRTTDTAVELLVADDGRGAGDVSAQGHGLIGMRERVALYGGTLVAGSRPESGFCVHACFQLGPDARGTGT